MARPQRRKTRGSYFPYLPAAPLTKDRKWAAGFGITTPYGIGSSLGHGFVGIRSANGRVGPGVFRYTAPYFAELKTINFIGTRVKLGDHFQVGAGLDVMWTELTLKQFYPWASLPFSAGAPDGKPKPRGMGSALGRTLV